MLWPKMNLNPTQPNQEPQNRLQVCMRWVITRALVDPQKKYLDPDPDPNL